MKFFHLTRTVCCITLFAIFLTAAPQFAAAQSGVISGTVTSILTNTPIPAVSIRIQTLNRGTVTDSLGHYQLHGLTAGYYNLTITTIGYKPKDIFDFQVTNSKPASLDITLENDVSELSEVKVTIPSFDKTLESPVSKLSIGSTEIKRNPGGNRDISKVLQSLPGVATSTSFRNDIIIRGGSPSENRFYIDGVEIPNINHFSTQGASGGPVGLINVDFIKSVDFYSGAFPADRGNALSSVIEFQQKSGSSEKRHETLSLGSSDLSATVEGPLGSKTAYLASYRYSFLQELFKLFQIPFLPAYQDFEIKIKTKLNQKNELTFLGLGAIDRFTINTNVPHTELNDYTLSNIPYNAQNNYTVGATFKHFASKGYTLFVLSTDYLNNIAKKYENNDPAGMQTLDYNSREIETKFRVEQVTRVDNYRINFGAGAESDSYSANNFNLLPFGNLNYHSTLGFQRFGLFSQVSHSYFHEKLGLSLGLRADGNNFSAAMENPVKTLSPRFSVSYNINEGLSINFNTGLYYQLPSYTLLGYRDSTGALTNKNVNYISNRQLVLGLAYNTQQNTRFSVEGFYKAYKDYPLVKVLGDSVSLANLGTDYVVVGNYPVVGVTRGRSYGVEFLAEQKLEKGFYGIFSFTLFNSEFQDKNGNYTPSSWDSKYILSATGGKIFKNNWEIGTKFRFTGGSPYTPLNIPASSIKSNFEVYPQGITDYSRTNALRLQHFYQLDLRVDKKYPFKKFTLNFYADIQNATDFQYQMPPVLVPVKDVGGNLQSVPGDPSRIQTRLLNNPGGNVTPTLGIIVEL